MNDLLSDALENRATILGPKHRELLEANGVSVRFVITSEMSGDQTGLYEITLAPRVIGANLHYHRFMDESFFVTKGTLTLQTAEEVRQVGPGSVAHFPRFTPHAFRNDMDEEAQCLLLFTPAQKREGFFRGLMQILAESPIDPEKYLRLYEKYDSHPVDTGRMLPV